MRKDAEKMTTVTPKALVMVEKSAQDTVHLIAKKKNSDAPSQTIQSLVAPSLHCASQNQRTIMENTAIINNALLSVILKANNCALDSKTIWVVILPINAFQPVSKLAQFNVPMMKSNVKVSYKIAVIVLIKISAKLKPRMSMEMPVPMILLLMDAQKAAVEIPSCAHPKKML